MSIAGRIQSPAGACTLPPPGSDTPRKIETLATSVKASSRSFEACGSPSAQWCPFERRFGPIAPARSDGDTGRAMSQENVEVVRASMHAADRGDAETALSYYSETVVFHPLVAGPYHGRAGVAEQMLTWMEEFDDFWFTSEDFIDAGDRVVLLWRQGGE